MGLLGQPQVLLEAEAPSCIYACNCSIVKTKHKIIEFTLFHIFPNQKFQDEILSVDKTRRLASSKL